MVIKQNQKFDINKMRDEFAAAQSIIPGLGHIYKGHVLQGIILFLGGLVSLWVGLILGFATAGIGLLIPVVYVICIGYHAYDTDDKRKHHAGIF